MASNGKKKGISFNSPVILTFSALCFLALILNIFSGGRSNMYIFSVYRSSFTDLLTYVRFFGHVLGHADWNHLLGNLMMILVVGPLLEEKYGSKCILFVILITALVTGLVHFVFSPGVMLLGASGVVFAFILLASLTSFEDGMIPMTFILVAVLYIGQQVYNGLVITDNISNLTHIVGGIVGAVCGFALNKKR
jgi:GlpG protein